MWIKEVVEQVSLLVRLEPLGNIKLIGTFEYMGVILDKPDSALLVVTSIDKLDDIPHFDFLRGSRDREATGTGAGA